MINSRKIRKIFIAVPALMLLMLLLSSCFITSRSINVEITCDEFNNNPQNIRNDFETEIGDKITVKLCSNPSTGFDWSYEITGDAAIEEEDHDFEEPESDVPGFPGKDVWTFEAVEKGIATVNMEYSQEFEGGIKGEWAYSFTVSVE